MYKRSSFFVLNVIDDEKSFFNLTCGLYYKQVTIIIYDRNDSGQYYKTTITIVIDDCQLW